MAGLGRKVFTAGDVLTASDMQSYVMDQTVMVFAGTAARSSAIATPTEGMFAVSTDDVELAYYNGSAWVSALPVGAWKAYTPTLSGLTIGNGTLNFVYAQIGKTVHVRGIATLGTTSTMTGPLDIGIPVTSTGYSVTGMSPIGNATFWSGAVPIGFGTLTSVGSASAFRILAINSASTYTTVADISSTVPFAWSTPSGKFVACSFTYEAA